MRQQMIIPIMLPVGKEYMFRTHKNNTKVMMLMVYSLLRKIKLKKQSMYLYLCILVPNRW